MKKTIYAIYAVSIALTGVAWFMLKQYVNISIYSALPLVAAVYMGVGAACMFFYGDYTRHTIRRNFLDIDFKYSKSGGEGNFHFIRDKATPGQAIPFVFLYAIISAAEIPFILFFSDGAKAAVGFSVFIISPVIQLLLVTKGYSHRIKRAKYEKEVEDRELDEQKRREEMGKWK